MPKFIFALFSVIALLGLIVPSLAHERGLLPRALRSAKFGSRSAVRGSSIVSLHGNVEVHNKTGRMGYMEFSMYGIITLSSVPTPCVFDPTQGTLVFAGNETTRPISIGVNQHFDELGPDSKAISSFLAPGPWGAARIWKVDSNRRLDFTSKNTVYIALDNSSSFDTFILTGNLAAFSPLYDKEVELYFV